MGCNVAYLISLHGIMKIAQLVVCLLTFALASASGDFLHVQIGIGWVVAVGVIGFVVVLIIFLLNVLEMVPGFLEQTIVKLGVNLVLALMFLTAGILAAVRADEYKLLAWTFFKVYYDVVAAASFFCFVVFVLFIVDIILDRFVSAPTSNSNFTSTTSNTVTTTVTTQGVNY